MFSPVQIKQEYPGVDEGNQNITNGIQAAPEYPIFTNQDVEYMYRQLPQFWGQAQVQTHQMVEDLASKSEAHIRQDMPQTQQPVQQLAVTNYLQQQSQPHVMPFQVEQQQHSHDASSRQQPQMSQQAQQQSLSHGSQEVVAAAAAAAHASQLMLQQQQQQQQQQQHPVSMNPGLLGMQSTTPTKHNGPGRPPKSTGSATGTGANSGGSATTPKKMKCQCEICFKEFGHKSNLFIHMRTHNGERPYKCTQCEKCFTHSGNLAIHMRTHSGERPYACQICGKMFSHSGNLSTHLRTHSGVKPYKCSVCGKEFRHSGNLSIHERIHSGIKPFQCKVCGKEFYHSGNLTTHMKKHPMTKNPDNCDGNEVRIVGMDPSVVGENNPVRLAVNVASTANRGMTVRVPDDQESVKNERREDNNSEESLQFAPPTS